MADQRMIGEILSERRSQLGLSVKRVADDTKLQPRMIEAFERSDFDAMPPKGYAQATLASYARYLDLDPEDVLPVYEAQLRRHQREASQAARGEQNSGARGGSGRKLTHRYSYSYGHDGDDEQAEADTSERPSARLSSRTSSTYGTRSDLYSPASSRRSSSHSGAYGDERSGRASETTRHRSSEERQYDESARFLSEGGHASTRSRSSAQPARQTEVVTLDDGYEGGSGGGRGTAHHTGARSIPASQKTEPRPPIRESVMGVVNGVAGYFRENRQLGLIVAGIVAALLLVLVIFAVTSCATRQATGNGTIPVTPVGGSASSDTTGTSTPASDATTTGTTTGTAGSTTSNVPLDTGLNLSMLPANSVINFFVSLDAATSPWIEVNVDGASVYAAQSAPGTTSSFTITRSATVTLSNPELVALSVNGVPVQATASNGTYTLTATVDPAQQPPADAPTADAGAADGTDATATDGATDEGGDVPADDGADQPAGTYAGMDGIEILHDEWGGAYYLDQNGDPNYYYDDGTPVA